MAKVPEEIKPVAAYSLDDALFDACQQCEVKEGDLLSWAVKKTEVVLILPRGEKVTIPVDFEDRYRKEPEKEEKPSPRRGKK